MSVPRAAEMPHARAVTNEGHGLHPSQKFCKGFPLKIICRRGEPPDTTKARGGEGGCGEGRGTS